MPIDDATEWFKRKYLAIWNHLFHYKQQLLQRIDKGDFWCELRACAYLDFFEEENLSKYR